MEEILSTITNQDSTGILINKSLEGFTFANDFICRTFGYSNIELLAFDTLPYLMNQNNQNNSEENIDKYLSVLNGDLQNATMVAQFVRKDGTYFHANVNMTYRDGFTVTQFENIVDIDESSSDVHDNNFANIAANYESSNSGVLIISTKNGIAYANKVANEAFGYKKDKMIGINAPRFFTHSSDLAQLTRNSIMVFTGLKSKATFSCRFLKEDNGTFKANLTIHKHKEAKAKYLILQLDNITQEAEALAAN